MSRKTISPAPDRRVRHPDGQLLEPGTKVEWTPYWQRRLDDEDVVRGTVLPPEPAFAAVAATSQEDPA
jgi:hypothetical protein